MAFTFPPQVDLPLKNAPLKLVVCQVRFEPILAIAEQPPRKYQELIRDRFPKLEIRSPGIEKGNPAMEAVLTAYAFKTLDGQTELTLGVNFVSITTVAYSHWQSLSRDLADVYRALRDTFSVVVPTRIGLRYINELTLENTKCQDTPSLIDFLNPSLSCSLKTDAWPEPLHFVSRIALTDNHDNLTIVLAFEPIPTPKITLDFDRYTETRFDSDLTVDALLGTVGEYHTSVYNAFRWSLREDKISVFGMASSDGGQNAS